MWVNLAAKHIVWRVTHTWCGMSRKQNKFAEKGWLTSLVSPRYSRLYIRDNYDKRLSHHWQDLNTTQKHFLPVAFSGRNIVINGHRCGIPSACGERSATINVTWTMTRNPEAFQGNVLKAWAQEHCPIAFPLISLSLWVISTLTCPHTHTHRSDYRAEKWSPANNGSSSSLNCTQSLFHWNKQYCISFDALYGVNPSFLMNMITYQIILFIAPCKLAWNGLPVTF